MIPLRIDSLNPAIRTSLHSAAEQKECKFQILKRILLEWSCWVIEGRGRKGPRPGFSSGSGGGGREREKSHGDRL